MTPRKNPQGTTTPAAPPQYLTLAQASERIATPHETIRYWIHVGKLTAYKPGRSLLVRTADLDALIESHRVDDMRIAKAKLARKAAKDRRVA